MVAYRVHGLLLFNDDKELRFYYNLRYSLQVSQSVVNNSLGLIFFGLRLVM